MRLAQRPGWPLPGEVIQLGALRRGRCLWLAPGLLMSSAHPVGHRRHYIDTLSTHQYNAKYIAQTKGVVMVEIKRLSPDEFKAVLDGKGWTADLLAVRWGMTRRRIQQIVADAERPRYYDDAVANLPIVIRM